MEKIKFIRINGKPIIDATHEEIVEKLNEIVGWITEQEQARMS